MAGWELQNLLPQTEPDATAVTTPRDKKSCMSSIAPDLGSIHGTAAIGVIQVLQFVPVFESIGDAFVPRSRYPLTPGETVTQSVSLTISSGLSDPAVEDGNVATTSAAVTLGGVIPGAAPLPKIGVGVPPAHAAAGKSTSNAHIRISIHAGA